MSTYFDRFVLPFLETAQAAHRSTGRRLRVTVDLEPDIFDIIEAERGFLPGPAEDRALEMHPQVILRRAPVAAREPDPVPNGPLLTWDEAAAIAERTGTWPPNVAPGTAGIDPPDPLRGVTDRP